MVIDIYQHFLNAPTYNKLVGPDYLFAEYKCPIETEDFQLISEQNFITYVGSGRKDWFASGKLYAVKEGDALFIRKGAYTTRQYFDEEHCVLTCFINDDFIRNFTRENHTSVVPGRREAADDQIFELDVNDSLKALFNSMFSYLKMGTAIPRELVELKFKELLYNIVLNPNHRELSSFFTSLNQEAKQDFDYVMMKNFRCDLELEDFARLCSRSLSTFKRDFKTFYNQTPGKWINDKRLEFAKTLLISSDLNINEVCYEAGFKNSSHFNKAFKDRYDLPPKQFRILSNESLEVIA
jgi:AraC-like DNA-binding protein